MGRSISGWKLAASERDRMLVLFPQCYPRLVADHVTLRFGTDRATPLPAETGGLVVGEANDGAGVQALVVAIGGTTARGDGSHFHITWSLAPGRAAKESNDVIAASGWRPIDPVVPVALKPQRWEA